MSCPSAATLATQKKPNTTARMLIVARNGRQSVWQRSSPNRHHALARSTGPEIPDGNVDDSAYFNLNVKCASRAQGALGLIISAGLTHSANWSPVKSPSASPASMSDVPSWCAFFATLAALS